MNKPTHIHILGICGTFMGGIAAIAKQAGFRVTGCDVNVYPPMSTQLQAQGIELISGFGLEQLELNPDLYVIGNVVTRGNVLMEEILNRNLPYASGPQWLSDTLLRDKWVLGVAGTHGKTTTTSLISVMLENCSLDPTVIIGGEVDLFNGNAKFGKGKYVVAEADESDGSFLYLKPLYSVITNIEMEHVDYYKTINDAINAYSAFANNLKKTGTLFYNCEDENIKKMLTRFNGEGETFGFSKEADMYPYDIRLNEFCSSFQSVYKNEILGRVFLKVPGCSPMVHKT